MQVSWVYVMLLLSTGSPQNDRLMSPCMLLEITYMDNVIWKYFYVIEKHKTYHQKDEILAKDGFKKYMKYEHCPYQGCAYSKVIIC